MFRYDWNLVNDSLSLCLWRRYTFTKACRSYVFSIHMYLVTVHVVGAIKLAPW